MKRDNSMTRRYLMNAGITPGMRVLEIGCGNGEVTQELAEIVGPSGSVVALDRNEAGLAMARARMTEQGIEHVRFVAADVTGDLATLDAVQGEPFDALAGRRVLMYLAVWPDGCRAGDWWSLKKRIRLWSLPAPHRWPPMIK
jgi:ubiquinone/menaquinone biosynthesis C-methylase UbiE